MGTDLKQNAGLGGNLGLWVGMLGAPIAWIVQFELNYILVPWACRTGHRFPIHLAGLVFLLAAGAAGLLSLAHWNALSPAKTNGDVFLARCRFMALLGILLSALFTLGIFIQGVAAFIIDPCAD